MRVFIACELPHSLLEALAETQAALRGSVPGRFVAPDSFHVTLAFLGSIEGYRVDDAIEALECACAEHEAFEAELGMLGAFGRRSTSNLWQGFATTAAFEALAHDVRKQLKAAGFSFDAKTFLPHVTLMRKADVSGGELPMPCIARGTITTVTLFSSDLSGERPVYEPLHRVNLT